MAIITTDIAHFNSVNLDHVCDLITSGLRRESMGVDQEIIARLHNICDDPWPKAFQYQQDEADKIHARTCEDHPEEGPPDLINKGLVHDLTTMATFRKPSWRGLDHTSKVFMTCLTVAGLRAETEDVKLIRDSEIFDAIDGTLPHLHSLYYNFELETPPCLGSLDNNDLSRMFRDDVQLDCPLSDDMIVLITKRTLESYPCNTTDSVYKEGGEAGQELIPLFETEGI